MIDKQRIIDIITEKKYQPKTLEGLADMTGENEEELGVLLSELEREGFLVRTPKQKYAPPGFLGLIYGKFDMSRHSYGFIRQEGREDYFVPKKGIKDALHGDWVYAKPITRRGDKTAAEIVSVAKRSEEKIIGEFHKEMRGDGVVIADSDRITLPIYIDKSECVSLSEGDKVAVDIVRIRKSHKAADGRILAVLGNKNDAELPIRQVMYKNSIPFEFPENVLLAADKVGKRVSQTEISKRLDLRDKTIITIDGADAKDLDDAISVEKLPSGMVRLGVHIADVSHYVTEGSVIDREAYVRGTSTYLADRVIPMLPPALSNGICSLNPDVARLCMSVFMDIDKNGVVSGYSIHKSVIKSKFRMTYDDVTAILENPTEKLLKKYKSILSDLELMKGTAQRLKKRRFDRGSIEFDFPEAYIKVDDVGVPVDILKRSITISNNIIEEFMLICNETIAEHIFWQNLPFIYRVHEVPDSERVARFNQILKRFGYTIKGRKDELHPKVFQKIGEQIKGTREERIISTMMLRSLMKASYSEECLGHFGLAAKYYCHFTSPIRRYPDLVIHRILSETLEGTISEERISKLWRFVAGAAKQSSEREVLAETAEREVADIKKAEYMSSFIGERFEGMIRSVTSFGMFVELDNTVDGLVRISDMKKDVYLFNEEEYELFGINTGKRYRIGDEVSVELVSVNVALGQIDFVIPEEFEAENDSKERYSRHEGKTHVSRYREGKTVSGRGGAGYGKSKTRKKNNRTKQKSKT